MESANGMKVGRNIYCTLGECKNCFGEPCCRDHDKWDTSCPGCYDSCRVCD